MNYFLMILRYLKHIKTFNKICVYNRLRISPLYNISSIYTLKEIFLDRCYSDYFPFYKDSAVIIDVGSHYGYFSFFSALNVAKNSVIYSIEPNIKNFEVFCKNIYSSSIHNIIPFNIALSSNSGIAKFSTSENSVNNHIITNETLTEGGTVEISTQTLEYFISNNNIDHVDFIKFDCEGAEYEILFNTPNKILKKIGCISLEFHDMGDVKYSANSLAEYLILNEFQIVKLEYSTTNFGKNYGKLIAINRN